MAIKIILCVLWVMGSRIQSGLLQISIISEYADMNSWLIGRTSSLRLCDDA